jgi:hypothetical protein
MIACAATGVPVGQTRAKQSETPQLTETLSHVSDQQSDREKRENLVSAIAKMKRNEATLRSLIETERGCEEEIREMASKIANNGQPGPSVACALRDKMIEQAPFDDFNVGVVGLHPNVQNSIKRAIVIAAYSGYKIGKGE